MEHIWMPLAHSWLSRTYPLKMRLKIFRFSTMEFLDIFAVICPFFGFAQWFRAKTTWETNPIKFLSTKKGILEFLKKISEKFWIIKKNIIHFLEKNSEMLKIPFLLAYKSTMMGLPCSFSSKPLEKTKKWANHSKNDQKFHSWKSENFQPHF